MMGWKDGDQGRDAGWILKSVRCANSRGALDEGASSWPCSIFITGPCRFRYRSLEARARSQTFV